MSRMIHSIALALLLAIGLTLATAGTPLRAASPAVVVSAVDSFRVGDKGVLCSAQRLSTDPRFASMFDRGYQLLCRDAASAVGQAYALKARHGAAAAALVAQRPNDIACEGAVTAGLAGLGGAMKAACRDGSGLLRTVYLLDRGDTLYVVEGFSAYDSALLLAFRSLVANRPVPGEVSVATTNAGDPAAFARVQATTLDPAQALAAGYRRNVEGSYAEAAEFFDALVGRARANDSRATHIAEYFANAAIQQSNLGNFAEAARLFDTAAKASDGADPLFASLFRNLRAIDRLNARDAKAALAVLDSPLPPVHAAQQAVDALSHGVIDRQVAQRLAQDDGTMTRLGGGAGQLSEVERASLLDAQAHYLRGVALRMTGDDAGTRAELTHAVSAFEAVRGGNVVSMRWLLAGTNSVLAQLDEAEGRSREAETRLREAATIYSAQYPGSATLLAARARLAALQLRHGDHAAGLAAFRELVRDAAGTPGGSEALRGLVGPYFDTLIAEHPKDAEGDFFTASQMLVRPGVAQTQAVFARELSGGSDEAAALFRQSVSLTREIVAADVEVARLAAIEQRSPLDDEALARAQAHRRQLGTDQTMLLARLAAFPKFRVMANSAIALGDLQAALGPDEAYYKLLLVGETPYAMLVRRDSARMMRVAGTRAELEKLTNTIRDSIVIEEANQLTTAPFDLVAARRMYVLLFGDLAGQMGAIRHLVFEPDGPLLKLPANVLVTDDASIAAYQARLKQRNPDEFDFTGVAWLGRDRMISTAVSAQSFIDVRRITPSHARRRYLGLGQNAPTAQLAWAPHSEAGRDPCDWGLALWNKPISSAELNLASTILGGADNQVITGADFSDSALRARSDLKDFRIIQFATHGLVTAPHPGCPARPALVTSFGRQDSDGLLSFKEIFDLRLDADTVILSACDTAGAATAAATREAGITTGGNFALDGLVRAFVGAGARAVVASHWPVPDDYDATRKLMSVIYEGGTTRAVGESMRISQQRLMDDPLTSHPYYWAAFAIVGDAAKPLTSDLVGGGNARAAR